MAVPADLEMLHRSFRRALRAENLAVEQFAAYLRGRNDSPPLTEQLERRHVEDFLNHLIEQGNASSTVNQRYRSLNRFFAFLEEEEEISESPMARMKPPHIPDKPVPLVGADQVRALLKTARTRDFLDLRDVAIVRLLFDTGMRRDELLGLKVTDLDFEHEVAIVLGKGRPQPTELPRRRKCTLTCRFADWSRFHVATCSQDDKAPLAFVGQP